MYINCQQSVLVVIHYKKIIFLVIKIIVRILISWVAGLRNG